VTELSNIRMKEIHVVFKLRLRLRRLLGFQ
jgi:hypothetical protein